MRLLIATTNPGKVREYQQLLNGLNCVLVSLAKVGITREVAEIGSTYAENALLKARKYAALSRPLLLLVLTVEMSNGHNESHVPIDSWISRYRPARADNNCNPVARGAGKPNRWLRLSSCARKS